MKKWEYCAIGGVLVTSNMDDYAAGIKTYYPGLVYFRASGRHVEKIRASGGLSEEARVAQTIATLGQEGWEMFCSHGDWLYFKRPLPELPFPIL